MSNKHSQAYPLHWPEGWPRMNRREKSRFDTSLAKALNNVEQSLRLFAKDSGKKVEHLVISSNYSLTERRPADAGVAVYFNWDGIDTCIAVDRYERIEENLQAIHHCVEAERTKLRHGGLNLVRAAFRGYGALPPPSEEQQDWRRVLGECATLQEAEKAYRNLRGKNHPDRGGDAGQFHAIQIAWEQAKRELDGPQAA